MLEVMKALKRIIEKYIINKMSVTINIHKGDQTIHVTSTRRLNPGDRIIIYEEYADGSVPEGEAHTIVNLIDRYSFTISTPVSSNYNASNTYMQKLMGFDPSSDNFIKNVYIGTPDPIRSYPAITIEAKTQSAEWLTIESITDTYDIEVTVMIQQAMYEQQYEMLLEYTKAIRFGLFRSLYPLVKPYSHTTLAEDYHAGDLVFRVQPADSDMFLCGWDVVFFENDDYLMATRLDQYMGSGVYKITTALPRNFEAGSDVISPRRHIYNTLPHTVSFGTINKGTMLKAAVISWKGMEEIRIHNPYIDPMLH